MECGYYLYILRQKIKAENYRGITEDMKSPANGRGTTFFPSLELAWGYSWGHFGALSHPIPFICINVGM